MAPEPHAGWGMLMGALPRIPRALIQWQRKPNDRVKRGHLDFVRSLRICIACGRVGPVEVMHVRAGTDGGMGIKPSSRYTLPGCSFCHRRQHQIGELTFWAEVGIDPVDTSLRLWAVTGNYDQGIRAIERARQTIELKRREAAARRA